MARRKHHSNGGMLGGLRKNIRRGAGAVIGITGFAIAVSPLLYTVQANQQTLLTNPGSAAAQIANTYGINTGNPAQSNLGQTFSAVVFPVLGGLLFILGMRQIVKHI